MLVGQAGVGKTRLAVEVCNLCDADGLRVVTARGDHAFMEVPLGAFAFAARPAPDTGGDLPTRLWHLQTAVLGGSGRRTLVCVDDAHLLDSTSLLLLDRIARTSAARVLLTVRTGDEIPTSITNLWSDGTAQRHEVPPLGRAELVALVAELVEGTPTRELVGEVWQASQGNPLCARELCLGALDGGTIGVHRGIARLTGPLVTGARTEDIINARLATLDAHCVDALRLLAVGGGLPVRLLEAATAPGTLAELDRRRLIRTSSDDRRRIVRTNHPLYGELLRRAMGDEDRRAGLGRLYDLAAGLPCRRSDDDLVLADWGLSAGRPIPNPQLLAAAKSATTSLGAAQAERFARAAEGPVARFLLASALAAQGKHDAADDIYTELVTNEDELLRTESIISRAWMHGMPLGNLERGANMLAQAADVAESEGARDLLRSHLGLFVLWTHGDSATMSATAPVLDRARSTSPQAESMARAAAYTSAGLAGRVSDALSDRHQVRSLDAFHRVTLLDLGAEMMVGWALLHAGRLQEALRHVKQLEDGNPGVGPVIKFAGAIYSRFLGNLRVSFEVLEPVRIQLEALGDPMGQVPWAKAVLVELSTRLAPNTCSSKDTLISQAELSQNTIMLPDARRCLAVADLLRGKTRSGFEGLQQSLDDAARLGHQTHAIATLDSMAEFGWAEEAAPEAARIAEGADAEWRTVHPVNRYCTAVAARDATGLDEAATAFADVGYLLRAGDAASQASEFHTEAGDLPAAFRSQVRARTWLAAVEALDTPLAARRKPVCSARSLEIALLAAEGATDAAIAQRLVLSPRTVGNHLHRTYRALGIGGRSDLIDLVEQSRVREHTVNLPRFEHREAPAE
ncbi:MAG: hypothetical protein H6531_05275 [Actinobacteria bacterium]|nr:hypothetical protein [Actinomycetota bacterium]